MNIFLIILVVLLAFSADLNIGRLATLWQFSEEDKEPCEIKLGLPDGASCFRDSLAAIRDISGDKGGKRK